MTRDKKRRVVNSKVSGINVFEDDKGRPYYVDRFTKTAYLLKDVENTYKFYSMRFFLGLMIGIIAYSFHLSTTVCILLGVAGYVFMEFRFRVFLGRLTQNKNFKPKQKPGRIESEMQTDMQKVVIKLLLFIALGVLLIINAQQQNFKGFIQYANYVFVIFAFGMAIFETYIVVKKSSKK